MTTPRQQAVYQAIIDLTAEKGYSPSVRELGERLGLASPSTVHAHLMQLERAGLVTSEPGASRTLRVIR